MRDRLFGWVHRVSNWLYSFVWTLKTPALFVPRPSLASEGTEHIAHDLHVKTVPRWRRAMSPLEVFSGMFREKGSSRYYNGRSSWWMPKRLGSVANDDRFAVNRSQEAVGADDGRNARI